MLKKYFSPGFQIDPKIPNQQALQMDNDAKSILNDTVVLVPGTEGLKDIRVVEAIYKSSKEGKVISL
ncbi:Gfo/Idh/MocA family oxidoreductase [Marivirga sp.]|uniref:Gfo/Idh/MocA family oxidoreductase n=1 Tax=Marivirga sp. TaxID=2018662 RepID=UPI003DA6F958